MKNNLVIVPARQGSKGLPGKNVKPFHAHPLIAWSIAAGLSINDTADVVLSTDSEEYADIGKRYGAWVPTLRPPELASDKATTADAVLHMVNHLESNHSRNYENIFLLEPTSPIRPNTLLRECVDALEGDKHQSLITIGEFWQEPTLRIEPSRDDPYRHFEAKRRQDADESFFPFGLAYGVKKKALKRTKSFYVPNTYFIKMHKPYCLEIDDYIDWVVAEAVGGITINEGSCYRPRVNG